MSQAISVDAYKAKQSEAEFQAAVIEFAEYSGWVCSHTRDSRGEQDGEPDLRCWRGDRAILAELKTETGVERQSQKLWRYRAEQRGITVHLWRPRHWPEIEQTLKGVADAKMAPSCFATGEKALDAMSDAQ